MSRMKWTSTGALIGIALGFIPVVAVVARDHTPIPEVAPASPGEIEVPTLAAATTLPSLAPLVEAVEPAVVAIEVDSMVEADNSQVPPMFRQYFGGTNGQPHEEHGEGSGFLISGDGLLLTNLTRLAWCQSA